MPHRSSIECPVDRETREWLDRRWQWLCKQFGEDRVRTVPLVLPTPEYFPDEYDGTEEDVEVMMHRVARYMALDPATLNLRLYSEEGPTVQEHHSGRFSNTSGLYFEEDGKFQICIEDSTLDDPKNLVATLAHELGHVHLLGHRRLTQEDVDHEPLTDLLTVYFGLGVFPANAAFHAKAWSLGGLSGWSIGRRGYLSMAMFGYAFALFARARGEDNPEWLRELRLDVRSAYKQARLVLDGEHGCEITYAPQVGLSHAIKGSKELVDEEQQADGAEDESNGSSSLRCVYCYAVIDTGGENDEPPVCLACKESISESQEEDKELIQAELKGTSLNRYVLYTLLILGIAALLLIFTTG